MKTFLMYIGDVYSKMCAAMKSNGIITGVLIAVIIVVIYSILIHPVNINMIVEKAFEKERQSLVEETERAIERRLRADEVISPILERIIEENHLGRALVLELHNNTKSLANIDFLFYSATIEVLNATEMDMDFYSESFQRKSVSNQLGALMNNMKYKDYLYLPDIEECHHTNHMFVREFAKMGAKSLLLIPLKDDKSRPLAVIVFTSKHPEMDYQQILNDITPHLQLFKQLLIG